MAEKTDREIIEETVRKLDALSKNLKDLFAWILGTIFLLSLWEVLSLLGNAMYPEHDNALLLIVLLLWTAGIYYSVYLAEKGKEN